MSNFTASLSVSLMTPLMILFVAGAYGIITVPVSLALLATVWVMFGLGFILAMWTVAGLINTLYNGGL